MSDLNFGGINFGGMANEANKIQEQIKAASKSDGKGPSQADLLKLQIALAKMQEIYGAMSAIISDVKTTSMSIIQKM